MDTEKLLDYARLVVRKGINVEKDDVVFINTTLDQPDFVNMVVEEAYKAGAKKVEVFYSDNNKERLDYKYCNEKTLSEMPSYVLEKYKYMVKFNPCFLWLDGDDPDKFNGLDIEKITKSSIAIRKIAKPFRDKIDGKRKWCIAAIPSPKWAAKVFPKIKDNKVAVEKLWNAILKTSRVDGKNACANWDRHNKDLIEKRKKLEKMNLKSLHYKSKNGTDFKVELINGLCWGGGVEKSSLGKTFNPNIPSEEVFTSPYKGKIEGIVFATKPLAYEGNLIEQFGFEFKDGKVSRVFAKKGKELLEKMISYDEGSKMLGEVALVPFDSPINNTEILFYNTLFDENACCHLALGASFKELLKGGEKYTVKEATKFGLNDSMIHVDFMIGSKDLEIVGEDFKGKKYQIFKKGNWAF